MTSLLMMPGYLIFDLHKIGIHTLNTFMNSTHHTPTYPTASNDPDGTIVSCNWVKFSGPIREKLN